MNLWIDQKYVGLAAIKLDRFKKKSDKLYNFRCPYCGDSRRDKSKARGYLFVMKDTISFKCHNCGTSASLGKFLAHVDVSLANAYRMEKFSSSSNSNTNVAIFRDEKEPERKVKKNQLLDLGLSTLDMLPEDNRAVQYAIARKIPRECWNDLYYANDMKVCEQLNPAYENRIMSEERLVIPFYDKLGYLSGVTGRALGNSKIRYVAVRITNYPMIYGLKNVNPSETIHILEGAIDSMFVDNAIAVGGSDLKKAVDLFDSRKCVLVFDNEPRNGDIIKLMEKMIAIGLTMVIWPQSWTYKDINEARMAGMTRENIMNTIRENTYNGLQLKLAIRDWKKT